MEVLRAIRANDLHKLEKLIKKGFDVNTEVQEKIKGTSVRTIPLCLATARRHFNIVQTLLSHGADIHKWNIHWSSPLHTATYHGFPEIIMLLLQHGADINNQDVYGDTPMHIAIRKGFEHIVNIFSNDSSLDLDIENNRGEDAMHLINGTNNANIYNIVKRKSVHSKVRSSSEYFTGSTRNSCLLEEKFNNIDEKEILRQKLLQLEINERNNVKAEKLTEINILQGEIEDATHEKEFIQNDINKLQAFLTQKQNFILERQNRKKQLEMEIQEISEDKKVKNNGLKSGDGLECPICFSIPIDIKVYQCINGHILCEECQKQINVCPMCRANLNKNEPIRNRAFEEIVSTMFSGTSNA